MYLALAAFVVLLTCSLGFGAYVRNLAWGTERSLWEDALQKAPGSARSAYNLARHYSKTGRLNDALELYKKSLGLNASKPKFSQALSLNAMASIYYIRQDYDRVVALNQKALLIYPRFESSRFNMVLALAKLGKWEKAADASDQMLARRQDYRPFIFLKGSMLLKQNKPEKALPYFQKALRLAPNDQKTLLNTGMSLSLMKQFKQADWFFRRALQVSPQDLRCYFYLIENSLKAGDLTKTDQYLTKLFASFSLDTILSRLNKPLNHLFLVSTSRARITPAITAKLKKISIEIARLGH